MHEKLLAGEIVGCPVKVLSGTHAGHAGDVIDETMQLLIIRTSAGVRRAHKRGSVFSLRINGENITIEGESLCLRPKERTKALLQRRPSRHNPLTQRRP
ncbi:hypothetical protein COY28_04230 [Candidatus Woesearchaeota archaeon CG_4_10_14_0_2_um_filter_57_5]|nr:MAG: hypothetical protein AUJ68_01120 [Candidatus Woesearchaeota archaeon CG1_02_57_44]PIZ52800.1 MAG: hypothetical protein COY28_04230 [Candidatus Woesearchaeota archaeon CG_4_10_14_0_2_um_filter_57_5]